MNARMRNAAEQTVVQSIQGPGQESCRGSSDDPGRGRGGRAGTSDSPEGQSLLGRTPQELLQAVIDTLPSARVCPRCGGRRRHKGRRERGLFSSVGAIRLSGPYWYCRDCGGQHVLEMLSGGSASRSMRELSCLSGTALAALLTFLRRNSDRMDYPRYERAGGPISNGPMESFASDWGGV